MRDTIARDVDGGRMTAPETESIDPIDLERLHAELERERARRMRAEAHAAALEERLVEMGKQLGVAEWLVRTLCGELTGGEPPLEEQPPRRWWLPWR